MIPCAIILKLAWCWFHYFYFIDTEIRACSLTLSTVFRVSAKSFSILWNTVEGSNDEPSEDERRDCARKVWYFVQRLFSFHTAYNDLFVRNNRESLHNYATPRYFLCDHIGYTIDHYFTTCSLVFLYTSFNEEGMVSSAKLKRCRFSGSTDKKTKVRWNAIHVCRFVLSFLAIFRADDALTTRFFKNDSLRIRCVLD